MSLLINKNYDDKKNEWTIKLDGEIDIYTAGKLKKDLKKILRENRENIRIDGQNLEYIDSTGLGVLIGALKKLKEVDRDMFLINIKPNIKKLLNITGLDKIFIIEEGKD